MVDDSVQRVPYVESHSLKANILMQPSSTLEFGGFIADIDSYEFEGTEKMCLQMSTINVAVK